jgi:hypothetical protein
MDSRYNSLSGRIKHYWPLKLLIASMVFSIAVVAGLFYLTGSVFFIIVLMMFVAATIANYIIFKKRGRFYLKQFSFSEKKFVFDYYDNDMLKQEAVKPEDFDYYFGPVRGDIYLVMWNQGKEFFKAYRSFGKHKLTFDKLHEQFLQNIPNEKIKKNSGLTLFRNPKLTYTKRYDGLFKMV